MYTRPSPKSCPEQRPALARRRGGSSGFSFIEVMIAVTLLAVLLVGVLAMNSAYINFNSANKYYATAVQLAENGVETFMMLPYTTLDGRTETLNYGSVPGMPNYTRNVTVLDYNATTCTIRSRAAWRTGFGSSEGNADFWPIQITVTRTAL